MDLFSILGNENFFKPLTSVNKRIYYECINELIQLSSECVVLYEANVRDRLENYLKNKACVIEEENEENSSSGEDKGAGNIVRKFRECGWLTKLELGRNGEYITNINPNCRRLVDFLNNMCSKKESSDISNHIVNMHEIIQSVFSENSPRKDRPYTSVVVPLLAETQKLKTEILSLKDNISSIVKNIIDIETLNDMGKYINRDLFFKKFFEDYFYVKHGGLIPKIVNEISDSLYKFKVDPLFEKAILEYSERELVNITEARDIIDRHINNIILYISNQYPDDLDYIDYEITKFHRLMMMRMKLLGSSGVNMQSLLDILLKKIKESNDQERDELLERLNDCINIYSQQYISVKSFHSKTRNRTDKREAPIEVIEISEDEKIKITKDLLNSSKNPYSIEKANDYFNRLFNRLGLFYVKSDCIHNRDDAIMFAAAFMYSGCDDFDYIVELEEGYEETTVANVSKMVVRRKM